MSDGEMVGLASGRLVGELRELRRQAKQEVPVDDRDLDVVDLARRLRVASVGHQHDVLVFHEHKGIRALEARQVAHVDRVGDEKRCDFEPLELAAEALDPCVQGCSRPLCARNTSASR